jgi:hypothetical protein
LRAKRRLSHDQPIPYAVDAARQGAVVGQFALQAQTLFADRPVAWPTQRLTDGALADTAVPRAQFRRSLFGNADALPMRPQGSTRVSFRVLMYFSQNAECAA